MAKGLNGVRLVVFDFGGVVRDSSAGLHEGYRRGFAAEGLPFDFDVSDTWHLRGVGKYDIAAECITALLVLQITGRSRHLPEILSAPHTEAVLDAAASAGPEGAGSARVERIRRRYKEFFNSPEAGGLVGLYHGAEEAISAVADAGYLVALLTNGNRVTVSRDLPFDDGFDLILSEDEVAAKKPSGQGLLRIMRELSVEPGETVFVCDAPNDIHAARDAGIACIAVLGGMGLRRHLEEAQPDHIVEGLQDVVRLLPSRGGPAAQRVSTTGGADL